MSRGVAAVVLAATLCLAGCAHAVSGTPTWPGARLERSLLTRVDFPAGVQYNRIVEEPGQGGGADGPPGMLSAPEGCSDGLTRVIADSAERGPGSALKYVVAYDGSRMVMTVLSWPLQLDRLAATAQRCEHFEAFFDPTTPGIPMTTTALSTGRPDSLAYQQTMRLGGAESSVFFAFENVGDTGVFGMAFPTTNPAIAAKGTLPQTFLETVAKQAERVESS